jgi:hypothetical protein
MTLKNKNKKIRILNNQLSLCKVKNLTIPISDLLKETVKYGFGKYKKSNKNLIRATAKQALCSQERKTILNYFNIRIKYLLQYYHFIYKKSTL